MKAPEGNKYKLLVADSIRDVKGTNLNGEILGEIAGHRRAEILKETGQFESKGFEGAEGFLKSGVNIDNTALQYAIGVGAPEKALNLLLASGSDVNAVDKDGYKALHYAAKKAKNKEKLKLLLDAGADARDLYSGDQITGETKRQLQEAAASQTNFLSVLSDGDVKQVKALLEVNPGLANFKDAKNNNETALQKAVSTGNVKIVGLILAKGADARGIKLDSISNEEIKSLLETAAERQNDFTEALVKDDSVLVKKLVEKNSELAKMPGYKESLKEMENALGEQIRSKVAHGGGDILSDTITRMRVFLSEGRTKLMAEEKSDRTKLIETKKALGKAIKKMGSVDKGRWF